MDLYLEIITPEKKLYSADIGLVSLPGVKGRFTVLKNHASIISQLGEGVIKVIGKTGKESIFDCNGGIFECKNNKATVLIGSVKA